MSKICKQCGGVSKETATFCAICGSKYLQNLPQMRCCAKCGNQLGERAIFCGNCGSRYETKTEKEIKHENDCTNCGGYLRSDVRFCGICGAEQKKTKSENRSQEDGKIPVASQTDARTGNPQTELLMTELPKTELPKVAVTQEKQGPSKEMETVKQNYTKNIVEPLDTDVRVAAKAALKVGKLFENNAEATDIAGEVSFTQALPSPASFLQAVNPIKHLTRGFLKIIKGFALAGKDKKKIIPAIILATIWITLTLLPALGIDMSSVRWLNWLTFAQGGIRGGITGIVGGVIGKGILAYLITGVFVNLINRHNPFKPYINSAKKFFLAFALKNLQQTALLILGAGLALIAFNFITWNASSMNNMAGIAAFFLAMRSMSGRYGFLKQLAASLITKKGCLVDMAAVNRLMGGWAVGFAFGTALSFVKYAYIGYATGGVAVIAAMVLFIVSAPGKGAVTV